MAIWKFKHVGKFMEMLHRTNDTLKIRCGIKRFKDIRKKAKVTFDGENRLEFLLWTTSGDYVVLVKAQYYPATDDLTISDTWIYRDDVRAIARLHHGDVK